MNAKLLRSIVREVLAEMLGTTGAEKVVRRATPTIAAKTQAEKGGGESFDKRCHSAAKDRPTISGIGGHRIVSPTNPVSVMPRVDIIERALNGDGDAMAELWYRSNRKATTPSSMAKGGKVKEKIAEHAAKPNALRDALKAERKTAKKPKPEAEVEAEEIKPKRAISPTLRKNAISAAAKAMLDNNRQQAIFELKSAGLITDGRKLKGDKLVQFIQSKATKVKPIVTENRIPGGTVADLRVK